MVSLGRLLRKHWGSQAATGSLPPLRDTGERVISEESGKGFNRVNLVRHRVAHLYAIRKIEGSRRVLDVGCGTGYGSAMVAPRVGEVVGVDLSGEAVECAKASHRLDNLEFRAMPATALGFPDGSFDAAYSVQVIEHIEDVEAHLAEVLRVLRPCGSYVVATPNRLTYSPNGLHNAFHVREYDAREIEALLATYFAEVESPVSTPASTSRSAPKSATTSSARGSKPLEGFWRTPPKTCEGSWRNGWSKRFRRLRRRSRRPPQLPHKPEVHRHLPGPAGRLPEGVGLPTSRRLSRSRAGSRAPRRPA